MMVNHLREAKACEEAAIRAEAEASEYRRKATELLKNAMFEAAMLEDDAIQDAVTSEDEEHDMID